MFTGIIQGVAKVKNSKLKKSSLFLTLERPHGWRIKLGDSIATDGVCLTIKKVGKIDFVTELMAETLSKTTFGKYAPAKVNLEPSLKAEDVLSGHFVLGHVDAVGKIKTIKNHGNSKIYKIAFPKKFARLVVPKGSIALDGISLTVVDAGPSPFSKGEGWFRVSLASYTLRHTTLGEKKESELVNLEFDIIAKYLKRIYEKG